MKKKSFFMCRWIKSTEALGLGFPMSQPSFTYEIFKSSEYVFDKKEKNDFDTRLLVFSVKKSLMLMHRAFFHMKVGDATLHEIFFLHDGLEDNLKTLAAYGNYCSELLRKILKCLPTCMYSLLNKHTLSEGCSVAVFDEIVIFVGNRREFSQFSERDKEMVHFCMQIVKKDVYFQRFSSAHAFMQRVMDLMNIFQSEKSHRVPFIRHEVQETMWDSCTEQYVENQVRLFNKKRELNTENVRDFSYIGEISKKYKGTKSCCGFGPDGVFQEDLHFHYLDHEKKNRNFYHGGCSFCM